MAGCSVRTTKSYLKAISLTLLVVFCISIVPVGRSEGQSQVYTSSFLLLNRPDGNLTYQLNVTIPFTLFQYYTYQNHALFSDADFPKYVTPFTLKPIADRLWQIYNNTEDFTNGVLMLVHQITYEETDPGKYPVETLVAGKGDCDLFVYIAASILEAGGIHTVLLYYKDQLHMELGVDIGYTPTDVRSKVYQIEFQNASYYIGECTGGKWREGWRIGECPTDYQNVTAQIISLQDIASSSFGQVSANLRELDSSTLSVGVSSTFMFEGYQLILSGQILPKVAGENVTLQANLNGGGWKNIGNVETQADGRFSYTWTPPTGTVEVQASWIGNEEFNGASSSKNSLIILPYYFVPLILTAILAVMIVILGLIVTRRRKSPMSSQPAPVSTDISSQQTLKTNRRGQLVET